MASNWPMSAWVDEHRDRIHFGLQVYPIDTPTEPGRHLLAAGQLAEALGLDAFFLGDHPARGLECWMHLAALAVTTQSISLGTDVVCIAYRHPVLLARLAADLDNLSTGRLILGLGCGWDAKEYTHFGMPFPPIRERQQALEEAITILRGAWGAGPFTFHGRYFQTTGVRIAPPPLHRPAPPLLIAGGGERVTLRQVAQFADACNLVSYGPGLLTPTSPVDDIRRKLAVLRQHCEALGRPFETILRTHSTGWLILGEEKVSVQTKLQHYFPQGLQQRYAGPWANFVVAGTPQDAVKYYQALVDAGIQYFVVQMLDAADSQTIRLLAEQVVPAIKG